jgi:hypothetical protein
MYMWGEVKVTWQSGYIMNRVAAKYVKCESSSICECVCVCGVNMHVGVLCV